MKRRHLAVTGLLACAAALAAAPPQPTTAAWASPEYAAGSFEAGTVLAPVLVSCSKDGLLSNNFTFVWTHPVGGIERTRYEWTFTAQGSAPAEPQTLSKSRTSLTVTPGLSLVTSTLSIVAVEPGGWKSDAAVGKVNNLLLGISCDV